MGSGKVLLAEDNDLTRNLIVNVLQRNEIEVDVAENGLIAFEKARIGGYGLILMDLLMPKMNGVEVIRKLSKNPPEKKNGAIYVLTNLSDDALIQSAIAAGATGCWKKTDLEPQELAKKVKEVLA